jgi:anti-sigma B factor antagonist
MVSMDLSTRECDGRVVVALRGELGVADAAAVAARERDVIVDLAGLEFIDSSGVAALERARRHARHAGGDLLLAGPRQQVLRVLALTSLIDVFSVHASVEETARQRRTPPQGRASGRTPCPRRDMTSAESSMSRQRDRSCRTEVAYQAAGRAAQDHRAVCGPSSPSDHGPAAVIWNLPAARVHIKYRPLHGRSARPDISDPARAGAAARRTRSRNSPVKGVPAARPRSCGGALGGTPAARLVSCHGCLSFSGSRTTRVAAWIAGVRASPSTLGPGPGSNARTWAADSCVTLRQVQGRSFQAGAAVEKFYGSGIPSWTISRGPGSLPRPAGGGHGS